MRSTAVVVIGALVACLAAACSPRTIGTPDDAQLVRARFATVENLVVGHAVRVADVKVGSVTDVRLDGYQAVVTMAVEEDRHLPVGTTASIRKTSLLGEDYVALDLPEAEDVTALPAIEDGAEIDTGAGVPGLEEVAERAISLLAAVSTDDVDTIVTRAGQALDGREQQIGTLVEDLAAVTRHYARQRQQIGAAIDGLGELGNQLDGSRGDLGTLVDDIDAATAMLARQRERLAGGLDALGRLHDAAAGSVLGETRDEFEATLADLGPVAADLGRDEERVNVLIDRVLTFVSRIRETIVGEELELYGLITSGPRGAGASRGAEAITGLLEPPR